MTVAKTLPLPVTLGWASVWVRDSAGSEWVAPLFYTSPRQVNHQIPTDVVSGEARVSIVVSSLPVEGETIIKKRRNLDRVSFWPSSYRRRYHFTLRSCLNFG